MTTWFLVINGDISVEGGLDCVRRTCARDNGDNAVAASRSNVALKSGLLNVPEL